MRPRTKPSGRMNLMHEVSATQRTWHKWRKKALASVKVAARLAPYVRKRRWLLAGALASTMGHTAMTLLEPWPLKLILDHVVLDRPLPSSLAPALTWAGDSPVRVLYVLVGAILLMAVARGVFYYYQRVLTATVAHRAVADLRLDLYSHIQSLSFSFHDRRRTGDILSRLTTDMRLLRGTLIAVPIAVAGEFFLVVGMTTVMFFLDWRLTLIALTVFPFLALLMRLYQGRMKQAIRAEREREGRLATIASEVLGAIKVVQGFTREQDEIRRFNKQNKRSQSAGVKAARIEAKFRWSAELVVAVGTATIIVVAAHRVLAGALSPGDLLVFVLYLRTFFRPLRRISARSQRAVRATASAERILDILETQSAVRDLPGASAAPRLRGEIEFEKVSFQYRKRTPVLSDITLRIQAGEHVAIVGPSGGGKTTLVSLIPRFYDPIQGRVCVDGRDVRELTLSSLRAQISIVFQEAVLFNTTIAENIRHGKPTATMEEIVEAAKVAGIHSNIAALADGYGTVVGERGGTLSGGQRQRVAVARAVIRDPAIVILDEPTVGLDGESADLVMEALHRLTEGRTVVTISHQLRSVQDADRVIVIRDGRIVEAGTPSAVMAGRQELPESTVGSS